MFFTSFHHSFTWDYFLNSYEYDAADGSNKALYCEPHEALDPPSQEYLENWLAMVNEVVQKYEPDMIWFDFGLGKLIPDEYQLIDIISKNGCMLLNVGPNADGSISAEAKDILTEMGDWMAINEEGVFETRPWTVFGEGPARMTKGGGFSEQAPVSYTSNDIRFTRSKDEKTVYAFVLGWPEDNEVLISSFTKDNGIAAGDISGVELLGSNSGIEFHETDKGIKAILPQEKPCDHAICLKFKLK